MEDGPNRGGRVKILIVDDDPDILEVIAICLETRWPDASLLRAVDGKSALANFASDGPDVIVLDLGLPDMDGLDVCRTIRRSSSVPIIILTVRDRVQDAAAAIET